jgi:hypothetical protein
MGSFSLYGLRELIMFQKYSSETGKQTTTLTNQGIVTIPESAQRFPQKYDRRIQKEVNDTWSIP